MITGQTFLRFLRFIIVICEASSLHITSIIWRTAQCSLWSYYHPDTNYLTTVWSSELDTLLMRYEVNLTPYRIKSVSNSLDQTVCCRPVHNSSLNFLGKSIIGHFALKLIKITILKKNADVDCGLKNWRILTFKVSEEAFCTWLRHSLRVCPTG